MKLCYKEYDVKMSLKAMKQFKSTTGFDLWCTLLEFIAEFESPESKERPLIDRMSRLYAVCSFECAASAFHALIESDSIPLAEVEDAMYHVGWLPSEEKHEYAEPWPLVMVKLVYELDKQFRELQAVTKKKVGTKEG